jgi:hypothetical protein
MPDQIINIAFFDFDLITSTFSMHSEEIHIHTDSCCIKVSFQHADPEDLDCEVIIFTFDLRNTITRQGYEASHTA